MNKISVLIILFVLLLLSCRNNSVDEGSVDVKIESKTKELTKADSLVYAAINAHGWNLNNTENYSFTFRNKKYSFELNGNDFVYSSEFFKKDTIVKDVLTNVGFKRYLNNKLQALTEEENSKYTEALNSVIYFTTLPFKLEDASVNKSYIEETTIRGQLYTVIGITFSKDGGGKDFDDEFHYWINKQTNKIDYLAYNYKVNNGGVRFRSAYNIRIIDGITFQDYINYEAPLNTPLKDLPKLFEEGKLKEISRIIIENINTNNK